MCIYIFVHNLITFSITSPSRFGIKTLLHGHNLYFCCDCLKLRLSVRRPPNHEYNDEKAVNHSLQPRCRQAGMQHQPVSCSASARRRHHPNPEVVNHQSDTHSTSPIYTNIHLVHVYTYSTHTHTHIYPHTPWSQTTNQPGLYAPHNRKQHPPKSKHLIDGDVGASKCRFLAHTDRHNVGYIIELTAPDTYKPSSDEVIIHTFTTSKTIQQTRSRQAARYESLLPY